MDILKDNTQIYLQSAWKRNTPEENQLLEESVKAADWSVFAYREAENEQKRGEFQPLAAMEIQEIEKRRQEFTEIGKKALQEGKVGAVLLAGGQGTRLGLDRPKGTLNIGIQNTRYLFQQLIENLKEVTDMAKAYVPLYIMTSNSNHQDTKDFFQSHNFFGYPKEYVSFFIQEMVPCCDFQGNAYLSSSTQVALSPNGNGGWFISMEKAGLLEEIHTRGIQWLNVFAVDNCLQRIADPAFVGATIASGCQCGAKVVKKAAPDEKIGVLCTEDGKPSIVEYYEMTPEMETLRTEQGELMYRFGVILNYLFSVKRLEEILEEKMPVHVVEKKIPYMDTQGNYIQPEKPNGYKFETLVLDMVHLMEDCLPYEVVREKEFAPIKNLHGIDSLDSARVLLQNQGVAL